MEPEEREDVEDHTPTDDEQEDERELQERMDWQGGAGRV